MANYNREEENNHRTVRRNMAELEEDVLGEIISRLPLNLAVQCKVLSKNLNRMISNPEFSQILLRRQKHTSTQLIYSLNTIQLLQISLNPITRSTMPLCYEVELLASCNGLILLDFEEIALFCVFNPMIRAHQLITYPAVSTNNFGYTGLAVDYPNPDQYKLVSISRLTENSNLFYKFHLLSSEQPGLWREIQLRTNAFISISYGSPPVYWRDSLYWLRTDGSVLAFDTKKEQGVLIERPEFIDRCDLIYDKVITDNNMWLGISQGILTLICIFKKSVVISAYNNGWSVSHTLDNFVANPDGIVHGFPIWIDSKQVYFLVQRLLEPYRRDLYEYDTEINAYRIVSVLDSTVVNYPTYHFYPTLASVHPSHDVVTAHLPYTVLIREKTQPAEIAFVV